MTSKTRTNVGIQVLGPLIGAGLILLIAYLLGWLGGSSRSGGYIPEVLKDSLIAKVKANVSVMDATVTDAAVLYIAAKDDGTDRDAMGRYYCQLAKENGVKIKQVKIIDVMSFKKESGTIKGKVLGWAFCD